MTTARSLADFLAGQAIGVVGLGLIGGSLGLDLRQRGHRVVGVAHRQTTVERALQRGLVDEASSDLSCLNGCGLVLLALPLTLVVIGSRPPSPAAPAMAPPSPAASLEQQLEQAMEPLLLPEPPSPVIPLAPDVDPAAVSTQAEPSAAPVEPLLELLQLDHSDDLVDRLRPRADQGLMELIPSKSFSALSMAERQQQADVWLAQLQDDGYERLVLLDEQGRLLGRSAQIGGGMILWSTPQ